MMKETRSTRHETRYTTIASFASCFLLLVSCLIPFPSLSSDIDSKANGIESKYSKVNSLTANFEQNTFVELLEKNVVKRGIMFLSKGSKFKIAYSGNDEKTYISNGNLLWIFIPNDPDSIEEYSLKSSEIPQIALSMLENFGNLRKLFSIKEAKEFNSANDQLQLMLIPKSKRNSYKKISVLFDNVGLPLRLKIYNESGNVSEYSFTGVKTDEMIPETNFKNPF